MNLHGLASGLTGSINPLVSATLKVSTGYTTGADGSQTPTYAADLIGTADVQALNYQDLQKLDGMNINGERRAIYFNGEFQSASRPSQQGGDLVVLTDGPNAGTWLTAYVLEQWPDWCKLVVTLQNGS